MGDPIEMGEKNLVLVFCECDGSVDCPQGRRGAQDRCRLWLNRKAITANCIKQQEKMNRFDR